MKHGIIALVMIGIIAICMTSAAEAGSSIGGGIHYLRTLGDIKDVEEWDPNAIGFLASYQYKLTLLKFEAAVEYIHDFGGTGEALIQPQAWALLGGLFYGGGGIGIGYLDGEWQDNPFYALRAGVELGLGPVAVDAFASYRFQSSQALEELDEKDLDSITFGAIVRFGF